MENNNKKNYLIYGFKASGKTTYAKEYSSKFNLKLIDLDQELIKDYHKNTVFELYNYLQDEFRVIEYKKFYNIINNVNKNTVLSIGGSTLVNQNIKINELKTLFEFILIDSDFDIIYNRIQAQNTIYKKYSYQKLKNIYDNRIELFRSWADKIIK